jgi:prepilin peptidase CpaA
MMPPLSPAGAETFAVPACLALLLFAAWHDVIARTIPNWIPAALALIAIVKLSHEAALWTVVVEAALLFGASLLLWVFGLLGGGDAKLLGAVGLLVPHGRIAAAIGMIALAGGVLALPYLACRGRIARPAAVRPAGLAARAWRAERFRLRRGGPLPYAVAIAVGTGFGLLGGAP